MYLEVVRDTDSKVKILTCYYKPWRLPKENIFFPIQAGKTVSRYKLRMQGDDTGDNISDKNATFSEFTAWYWGWKKIKTLYPNIEYIGLSHYRRFFALDESTAEQIQIDRYRIPRMEDYENLIIQKLEDKDIILVRTMTFADTIKKQYEIEHDGSDYYCIKDIMHEICPEYDDSFLHFFEGNKTISLYCIFIARYELFDQYFEWLFPLLFEAEKRMDFSNHNTYQKRAIAFLAERLLNVYVLHHKLRVVYEPIYYITNLEEYIESKTGIKTFIKRIIRHEHHK